MPFSAPCFSQYSPQPDQRNSLCLGVLRGDLPGERLRRHGHRLTWQSQLQHRPLKDLSLRIAQRHFLRTTGLTQSAVRQIERARYATILLQQGVSILDVVYEAGYFDQPHLTRSLKYFIGQTPTQILDRSRSEQLSFLYKTAPFR
jgi:Helix-turn-helix domain